MTTASSTDDKEEESPGFIARSYATALLIWKLKHYIPTVATTTLSYYTSYSTSYPQGWALSTALFVALAKYSSQASKTQRRMNPQTRVNVEEEIRKNRKRIEGLIVSKSLPKNGAIFETSFNVDKRELGGVLRECDVLEDGNRVIKAEWSAHDSLFTTDNLTNDRVLLYFHGGAYCLLSPKTHRPLCLQLSKELNCRVFSVDYRLSPETKFPGHLHDAVSAYYYLTSTLKIPASNILVSGDSAGGNLATALLLYLRDESLPLPKGGILLSPWLDFTCSFSSWDSNSQSDYIQMDPNDPLVPQPLFIRQENDLIHPYVSPCISISNQGHSSSSSLKGLPPLIVLAGGSETLRDEISLFCQRASRQGVKVRHEIFEGGVHVFIAVMEKGMGKRGIQNIGKWYRNLLEEEDGQSAAIEKVDNEEWKTVGIELRKEWDRKQASLPQAKGSNSTTTTTTTRTRSETTTEQDRFIYEETFEEAPEIELRENAHPVAVQAFEENSHYRPREGLTIIVKAKRNPQFKPQGWLARLHL